MTPHATSSMNSPLNPPANPSANLAANTVLNWLHRAAVGVIATVAIACQAQPPAPLGSSPAPAYDPSSSVGSSPIVEASSPSPSASPSTDPSPVDPGLASYSNSRFGFSFSYAVSTFVANESGPVPSTDGAVAAVQIWTINDDAKIDSGAYEGGTEYPANVSVSVLPNPNGRSLTDWVNQSNWFSLTSNFSETTVAGQAAIAFQSEGLYSSEHVAFSTPDGANIILISFGKIQTGEHDAVYERAFRGILESFQFTPQ